MSRYLVQIIIAYCCGIGMGYGIYHHAIWVLVLVNVVMFSLPWWKERP